MRFRLKTKPVDLQCLNPQVVYCSPLQRALRTALVAYPDRRVVVDPRLREIGTRDGMLSSELCAFIAAVAPERKANINTTKVRDTAWWGEEDEKMVHTHASTACCAKSPTRRRRVKLWPWLRTGASSKQ